VHTPSPGLVEEAGPRITHVDAVESRSSEGGQHSGDVSGVRRAAGDDGVERPPTHEAARGPCALQDPPAPMIRKIEQTANLPAKSADDTRLRTPCGAVRVRRRRLTVATRRPQPARHGIVQIVERARAPANMHVDARRAWRQIGRASWREGAYTSGDGAR